ncbi:MAG TPA: FAD-dependent oxidoreductase [Streptosporangiaceae bacterium]
MTPRERDYDRLVMAAEPKPFWLDRPDAPAVRERLRGQAACDLAVIGGGFTGLWTALLFRELYPERSVVLVEGSRVGWAASGRNGGFCEASLTHGAANGKDRFPGEFDILQRLGAQNLDAIQATVDRYGIDCGFERTGTISVATEEYQVVGLRASGAAFLDADAVRAEVNSPTYLAGAWDKDGTALVQPAALAWGLAAACERLGVRIAERTPAVGLASDADGVRVRLRDGVLRAGQVALGTSAFPALVHRLRPYIVPVYDYVLVTEPLSPAQQADSLPAGAARLPGRPGHPLVPGPCRPPIRQAEPVASGPGRGRDGFRLLKRRPRGTMASCAPVRASLNLLPVGDVYWVCGGRQRSWAGTAVPPRAPGNCGCGPRAPCCSPGPQVFTCTCT